MTSSELLIERDALDQEVVSRTLGQIQEYLREQAQDPLLKGHREASQFIDGVYDQYAPEVPPEHRIWGKILGGAALALAKERYGRDELSPELFSGSYEQDVLATYHHAQHPRGFIVDAFRYARVVNRIEPDTYHTEHYVRFPIIGAFHDLVMGNKRVNDERQSAILASEVTCAVGMGFLPDEPTYLATESTTWNIELKRQSFDETKDYLEYQRAACVADLLPLFDKRGPYQGICCVVEDFSKNMHGNVLNEEAAKLGVSLVGISIDDCMHLIDSSPVLRAKYAEALCSQTDFFINFQPADPRLDAMFPGRADNIMLLESIRDDYLAGHINAYQTLIRARNFMNQAQ